MHLAVPDFFSHYMPVFQNCVTFFKYAIMFSRQMAPSLAVLAVLLL